MTRSQAVARTADRNSN